MTSQNDDENVHKNVLFFGTRISSIMTISIYHLNHFSYQNNQKTMSEVVEKLFLKKKLPIDAFWMMSALKW